MDLIGASQWAEYQSLMMDAHDTFEQKEITWLRYSVQIQRFGEDKKNDPIPVTLRAHLLYNYMRSWPITLQTESGEIDKQSLQVYINKQYLGDLGYINANGAFDYNPDYDRFIIDGLTWKPVGDTAVAQAGNMDILVSFILKREETETGNKR